tara:strand:- start:310 stop:468 length:159 start_codon:yes stop_codon:yes gene_type:complete
MFKAKKMFEKGLLLYFGVIALANICLFMLFIYYSASLLISARDIFLESLGLF